MFPKMFKFVALLAIAVATVLVTPGISQAQRYFANYGTYQSYYQPPYGYYGPYYGSQRLYMPSYGYPNYYRPYLGNYYGNGYPGSYGVYPRYGYYPNYMWR